MWSGATIGRILTNRVYLGEKAFRSVTTPAAHEPLIDADLFARAGRIMAGRGEATSRRTTPGGEYLLTGLVSCGVCGSQFIGSAAKGRTVRYRYYVCARRARLGRRGCASARLRIVNGGQTTASIHSAFVQNVDLSDVFVQMKLSIVDSGTAAAVVPKISEYANSQNRVSQADFFSNHPFHVRIEEFSRRIYAPAVDGSLKQSKWFYERARGQYQDARSGLTTKKRKEFDLEYPREQLFGKTDLAKYSMVWAEQPHIVSRGAQRRFAAFATDISKKWENTPDIFSEAYYRAAIAKAITWKTLESLVPKQDWYEGGYRANIVAYAIAKLAFDLRRLGLAFDFEAVWRDQILPPTVKDGLVKAGEVVLTVLVRPEGNRGNVTEWAKHEDCWQAVRRAHVDWPHDLRRSTIEGREAIERANDGARDQKILNGIAAQTAVVEAGRNFWQDVLRWARERRQISPKEAGILNVCGAIPAKIPTEAQSLVALETYHRLRSGGLPVELPTHGR